MNDKQKEMFYEAFMQLGASEITLKKFYSKVEFRSGKKTNVLIINNLGSKYQDKLTLEAQFLPYKLWTITKQIVEIHKYA